MHDFRAAELAGQAKFRDFEVGESTPRKPANVNDSDLYPAMPHTPVESTRPMEMIWCMFRSDLATFAATQKVKMQKLGKAVFSSEEYVAMDNLKVKDDFIKELEDMVETKYLRFCDPSQPLQLLTLVGARYATNIIRLLAHHPRRWANLDHVPVSEQNLVWEVSIQLLEQYNMMLSSPQLRPFAWNAPYFIQWHAVIHILDTLRANLLHLNSAKGWRIIETLYENNSEMLLNVNRPVSVAVGNLCLKAFSANKAALTKQKGNLPSPPDYITKLREQRETAKARREALAAKKEDQVALEGENRLTAVDVGEKWASVKSNSVEVPIEIQPQQFPTAAHSSNPLQESMRTRDDSFWLNDTLDNGFFTTGLANMMNQGTDAILAQDSWLDFPNDEEVIDWTQWDAWLGNLEPLRPNGGAGPGRGIA